MKQLFFNSKPNAFPLLVGIIVSTLFFTGCNPTQKVYAEIQSQRKALQSKAPISEILITDPTTLTKDLQFLSSDSLKGRFPGTKESYIAQDFIINRLKKLGVTSFNDTYKQHFTYTNNGTYFPDATNIIGYIPGTTYPENYIVLSAHYDHLGVVDGKIYNGADDNASGVCGLLALAQYFSIHKPSHSLVFCFFDAEESEGTAGSAYFVDHSPINLSSIKMNINLDMISRNDTNDELIIVGTNYHPKLRKIIVPLQNLTNIDVLFGFDKPVKKTAFIDNWTESSDHAPFHKKGIPFLYMGVMDTPDYHQHTDEFEKVNLKFYGSVVNLITNIVIELDKN